MRSRAWGSSRLYDVCARRGATLDANLGRAIEGLRPRGIPIAVISNASLLWQQDVRADLLSITVVHPMREDAARACHVRGLVRRSGLLPRPTPHESLPLSEARLYPKNRISSISHRQW